MRRHKPAPTKPIGGLFDGLPNEALFTVKRHQATRLHFDLRFEVGEIVHSFAVVLGISRDPNVSREAVYVDDEHRVSGFTFEGVFPEGMRGAGPMLVWEYGGYRHTTTVNDQPISFDEAFTNGRIEF